MFGQQSYFFSDEKISRGWSAKSSETHSDGQY